MSPLVLVLDDQSRAHLTHALERHAGWCRTNAVPVPPALADLAAALADVGGRCRPEPATGWTSDVDGPQDDVVLLSFDEAAGRMALSVRTIGRLAASGRLVKVGRKLTAQSVAAVLAGVR